MTCSEASIYNSRKPVEECLEVTYPTPGSLGADLFEMNEQEYVARFGEPLDRPHGSPC